MDERAAPEMVKLSRAESCTERHSKSTESEAPEDFSDINESDRRTTSISIPLQAWRFFMKKPSSAIKVGTAAQVGETNNGNSE